MTELSAEAKRELLARLLRERASQRQASAPSEPVLRPVPRAAIDLPLSFGQERMWFLDQLHPGSPVYNLVFRIGFRGRLDVGALERSLEAMVARHEALRTVFPTVDARPVQRVLDPGPCPLPVVDLHDLPPAAREGEAQRTTSATARRSFDLAQGPLWRAVLLRLDPEEHVLVLIVHHIVSDGWSLNVVFQELKVFYTAFVTGASPALPPLPVQYTDFAHWHRQWLTGDVIAAQRDYWMQQLGGSRPVLDLPTDRPRPATRTFEGTTHSLAVETAVVQGLRELSRREGVTFFTTLLAAFKTLLLRYTGQDDLIVGTLVAGRMRAEIEHLLGFFVNTLALRSDLSGDPTFREALRRTRDVVVGAHAHADYPFEKLIEDLQPERDLARNPLFQVLFNMLSFGFDAEAELPGVRARPLPSLDILTVTDGLTLYALDGSGGLDLCFVYSAELFDADTIARMAGHFQMLLAGIVADPDRPLSSLPLLTAAERHFLEVDCNATAADFALDGTYGDQFEAQARRTPDAIAAVDDHHQVTYAELNRRASDVARRLIAAGVGRGHPVALLAERSIELLTWILAVFKAGGAYLPLDPRHPPGRYAEIFRQSRAPVVVVADASAEVLTNACESLPETERPRVVRSADLAGETSTPDLPGPARPDDVAYIIYTSGSTGVPKGAMVHHAAMLNHFWSKIRGLDLTAADAIVQSAPQGFDISVWQFLAVLLVGGRVRIASDDVAHEPERLFALVDREGLSVLEIVPSFLRAYLDDAPAGPEGGAFDRLRWLVLGGEVLSPDLCRRWLARHPRTPLVNGYGPSECADDVTRQVIRTPPGDGERTVPIGRPIHNARIYVVDRALALVPIGVPGELCIGGSCVGLGYLNDPGRTSAAFVPDPFDPGAAGRLYRTGDRARVRRDGTLEFLGRFDHQVKIRGHRIELGEIEAVVAGHPKVKDGVVHVWPGPTGDRLVAYVVPIHALAAPAVDELRDHARAVLPGYMVPDAFEFLDALPRNPNGKVDRAALPAPATSGVSAPVWPRTPCEEVVANVWADVLGLDRIGVHDNFFVLGGHSLLATRVVSRLRQTFAVDLPVRRLFEQQTVAELASHIDALQRSGSAGTVAPPMLPVARTGPLPLSFGQQRLWFIDQLEPGTSLYNVPLVLALRGAVDVPALEASLGEIVRRHEALRTTFPAEAGRPVQRIEPPAPWSIPVVDLSALDAGAREHDARRLAVEEGSRPFDLARGPLLRVTLLRLEPETHHLLLTAHHIVIDGWSLEVLFRELLALYTAFTGGAPASLPHLPVQYADFSDWQRARLEGEALDAALEPWRRRLSGVPQLELATDSPRPPTATGRAAAVSRMLSPALVAGLRALSRREGVTLFMTLLAGFTALLARYSSQDDIAVGVPVAGRTRPETEPLIGLFVNTLVLRTSLAGDPTMSELLRRVRDVALEAYTHQDVPFERLVQALQPVRDPGRNPLFQVLFNMLELRTPLQSEVPGLALKVASTEQLLAAYDMSAKFDLSLNAWTLDGEAGLRLVYNADLFATATAERMLLHLERLLTAAAATPEAAVAMLPLLTDAEREQILVKWNDTVSEYPGDRCLHELFEAEAERSPDALAITFDEVKLTYRELNERANRLAHRLRAAGVGPDLVVGICVERSPEMVVGLLGILKAGAAYLPLDPDLPPDRLGFMATDTGARTLVTRRRLHERLPAMATVLYLDAGEEDPTSPAVNPERITNPGDLAYIIYTSGSTGQPKGTMVEHRSVVNYLVWANRTLFDDRVERIPVLSRLSFDASLKQIFGPLIRGGAVWIVPDEVAADPEALLERIGARTGVALNCVPSLWRAILALIAAGARPPGAQSLVATLLGGEEVTADLVAQTFVTFPDLELWNLYGPTETTANATAGRIRAGEAVTIGRPLANTTAYILDARMQPVPVGVTGELNIGGVGVARGYRGRPELTAERFLPDPFRGAGGARLYRTGDRARYLPDGRIEFLGRRDFQVKVRGFRIELGEIEAALRSHPDVRDVAVTAVRAAAGTDVLVSYVVGPATDDDLRRWLRTRLPEYMVPSAFVSMPALPLMPTGKLDRSRLPAPTWTAMSTPRTPPRTPTEALVAGIWGEVLGLPDVAIEDDFFALGGHSLLATQVVSRLRAALQSDLPVRILFEASTVEDLATLVDAHRTGPAMRRLVPIDRTGQLDLSFQQERLWFFDQFEPGSATFNMSLSLRLVGRLDPAALRRCLAEIRRRHESLRTTFGAVDGRPVQLIGPPGELPLPLTDLSGLDPAAARTELGQRAVEEAQRPFDLAHGPLLRTHLFRLGDLEHVLVVSAHHIVADGWSFSILLRELADLYPAFARDRSSPLAEISIQYADYADWQRRSMDDSALRSSLSYWQRTLADAPTLELPTDRPRPARQTFRGAAVPRALSPELSDGLRALGLAERATLFMTLLAAFKALLARHAGCEDVVVGAPVAGRTRAETEPLIGFFLNTLALRDDLSGDPSFRELLGRVRSTVVEALANQDVPFEKVLEALRPDRDLSRTPLFQVFFNVLNFPRQISPEGSELGISPLTPDLRSLALDLPAKFDLSLYASELPDGIGLLLLYNADLFEASTATTLMRHFEVLLTAAVRAPNTPLSALPLVSDAERAAAIIRPSRPFVLFPPPDRLGSIPERFRAIVAQHADRVAVESRGTSWTYRELDAMARGISRAVQAAAGGDGARVGLLLEHDAPMVAAVLGVLDSGNAYVPLDPRYPRERLAFMVADAESGVLVTSTRNLELARSLAAASVPIVNVDEVEAAPAGPRQAWPHPDAMAYILYTSGSTGQPKGVVQSHRNVLHHIEVYTNNLHIASEDRLALLASFSFDAAVMDVFGALLNGATLCLRDVREEGVEGLADWLGRERITIYHSTPTLYRAVLLDLPETRTFPHVRLVVLGGEEAVRRDVELYRRHFTTDCLFVNGLGPTESTVSFQHFIDHQTPLAGWSVPVGGAVSETELVLLDPNGRPTTLGGEIGIRSPYVALGYWRQPELTAAAFRPDPEGGARRIYRTGDLGRLRPDGTLEFLGRRDDQVKVRGVRIEPAEVESAIDAHPGVRRSVVVARDDGEGHYLAAYVIPRTDPAPTVSALLGYARERLPASMVPSVFVTLDAVPLTPSGKVDRRALPAPDRADRARRSAPVAPRTAVEIAVAAIWSEVLGVEAVGTEDNFFELGGHSLMATRVLSRLRAQLHVDIPLRALFEGPTVAALATLVEAQRGAHAVVAEREEIEL